MRHRESDILLPVEIAGLKFRNPFYVGSGPTTMTVDQLKRIEETGWGGAALKLTIDPPPYINRQPRYGYWADQGILSFTTEKRLTFEEGLRLMEAGRKATSDIILMSNITYAGDKGIEGWVNMAKKFEEAGAHANELNMCCPNMSYNVELSEGGTEGPKTGASLGRQSDVLFNIVCAIKQATHIPLFVKLTPEGGGIAHVAKACFEAGADVVGGTANRLAIHHVNLDDPGKSPINLQEEISMQCMCSDWVHPLGLRDIYEIRKLNGEGVHISGAGGIRDWKTAAQALLCGADLLVVCAETLISGYGFIGKTIIELKKWLKEKNYSFPNELRNVIPPKITASSNVTLYEGNARLKNQCLSAPCVDACPAHVPAQAYISKIAEGEFEEAFKIITSAAPLQSICGYICNHPCEKSCTRGSKDEAIQIKELKRFIIELGRKKGWKPVLRNQKLDRNAKRVAIIGSGPSGLSAALLLANAGHAVTVFEKEAKPGGMLRYAIPLFRLPEAALDYEIKLIESLGVKFVCNKTLGKHIKLAELKDEYDAVYLAVGAQKGLTSMIKGEHAHGVVSALDFLKNVAVGKKVNLGKTVAVVGGGFTAVDSARAAVRLGAQQVYILYRRTKDEMPATAEEVAEAEAEGVKVMYLVTPKEIVAIKNKVVSIKMVNCVLGEADKSKRRRPEPVVPAEFELPVNTVIFAVGQEVDLPESEKIETSKWGTIKVDENGFTGDSTVYAGGDAVLGASSVIEAVASAKQAAWAIDRLLSNGISKLKPIEKTSSVDVDAVLLRNGKEPRTWRVPLDLVEPGRRTGNFDYAAPVISEAVALAEAKRCYRCGCGVGCQICFDICKMFAWDIEGTRVNLREKDCVACGMCVWRCPNGNIEMIQTSKKAISTTGKETFKVVILDDRFPSHEHEKAVFAKIGAEVVEGHGASTPEEILALCADADGITVNLAAMNEKVINGLEKCKVIARYGVGYDNVDIKAATAKKIAVVNVPDYCEEEVSDQALALFLACVRKISLRDRRIREGAWNISKGNPMYRIRGKVFGLIGYGRIPQALHRKIKGFDFASILVADPFVSADLVKKNHGDLVDLETLIKESDYISMHAPLTEETRHMFGAEQFKMMKKSAIFINTSRGGVVDTEALFAALKDGTIDCAGLDVHEQEPVPRDYSLMKLDNVILSDHAGWYSEESMVDLQRKAAESVAEVLQKRVPKHVVNKDIYK